jgi:ABC-type multidrug transport system fused ATPase/permease subunit
MTGTGTAQQTRPSGLREGRPAPRWLRRVRPPRSAALEGTIAVVRLLPRVDARRTALLGAGVLAGSVIPVATGVCLGLLAGSVAGAAGLSSPAGRTTLVLFALVCLLSILERVVGQLHYTLATTFARQIDLHLQERVMAAVGRPAGVAHLEDPQILDLIKNAQGVGTEGLRPGSAVTALATLLPSWLRALGAGAVLLAFSPWLGLAWIVAWPLVLAVLMREYIRVSQAAGYSAATVRRAQYFADLALAPGAAKEVRVWGLLDWLVGRFQGAWLEAIEPVWRQRRPGRPVVWLTTAVVVGINLASYVLLAYAALRGDIALAALAVYAGAVQAASSFRAFDDPNAHLAYAAVAVPSLLDLERRLAPPPGPASPSPLVTLAPDAPREAVRFEGVRFAYPGQEAPVLDGLDLTIPAGRSLAVVGANGAGKTTLIKLLCGLYEPSGGRVTVDGVDLRTVPPADWQRRVAAIFQDFVQYHLTARENVGLGAPAHADDLDRLRAAAEKAGAAELIESLPRGWDTVLSRRYEGGTDLSGGQWQRIALARALFAVEGGARVLILDEPTAALDVRAEAALYDRFLELTAGLSRSPEGARSTPGLPRRPSAPGALTTIVISHRFSTVRRADRIVVLDGGRVVEDGTHDSLVAAGGRYATMFALQAARFGADSQDSPGTRDAGETAGPAEGGPAVAAAEEVAR